PGSAGGGLEWWPRRRAGLLGARGQQREQPPQAARHELAAVDTQLLVLYAALVRRLWQRAESLPYLNDRPYSLALYLLFGPALFHTLVERATFHFEYVVERQPELCPGCARE